MEWSDESFRKNWRDNAQMVVVEVTRRVSRNYNFYVKLNFCLVRYFEKIDFRGVQTSTPLFDVAYFQNLFTLFFAK